MSKTQPRWKKNERLAERNGIRKTCYIAGHVNRSWEKEVELREYNPTKLALNKWTTKQTYTGEWKNNKRHGYGTQISGKGKYEGEWVSGKREGRGIFWRYDPDCPQEDHMRKEYAGEWSNGKKHGFGLFYCKNGDVYEGYFHEGHRHGEGQMQYINGNFYTGNWVRGKRSGSGKMKYANGDEYNGTWLLDKKEGSGEYYFLQTNRVLVGEWADNIAACGVFAELDEQKHLPELKVKEVDTILKDRIREIRKDNYKKRIEARLSVPDVVFSKEELNRLRRKFKDRLYVDATTINDEDIIAILESETLMIPLERVMKDIKNRKWTFNDLLVLASVGK